MEAVIVARFLQTANLVLQSQNDCVGISNLQWFHARMKPQVFIFASTYDARFNEKYPGKRQGRIASTTGGSSGIGRATARQFGRRGIDDFVQHDC
jgi:hypothetical protein